MSEERVEARIRALPFLERLELYREVRRRAGAFQNVGRGRRVFLRFLRMKVLREWESHP